MVGFNPDSSAMLLKNPLTDSQTDARSFILSPTMEALKDQKDTVEILGIDANPIVGNGKNPFPILEAGGDMDFGDTVAPVFDGVSDEVLKQLDQLRFDHDEGREGIVGDLRATILNGLAEIVQSFLKCRFA